MRGREMDIIGLFKTPEFESAMNVVGDLYKVPRTGWLMRGVEEESAETVGEHTDSMIKLFREVIDEIDPEKKFDRKKMERMIQIHDWAESSPEVGDQITFSDDPEIEGRLVGQKKSDELKAMEIICAKLGEEGPIIMELWNECEDKKTPEGKLIKEIDKLQAVVKAYEYELAGEEVMAQEFIDSVKKRGQVTNPILVEIMQGVERKCKKFD